MSGKCMPNGVENLKLFFTLGEMSIKYETLERFSEEFYRGYQILGKNIRYILKF